MKALRASIGIAVMMLVCAACTEAPAPRDAADGPRVNDAADEPAAAVPDTAVGGPAVDASPSARLAAVLREVLHGAGPTPRDSSWFSDATAEALIDADVDSAGHAVVDFRDLRPIIGNASSSAGSSMLIRELNAAVFSVPDVQSVEYRMEGSCDLFWDWLQYGCHIESRPGQEP